MENREENDIPVEETKKSVKVISSNKENKPRFFEEEQFYCCLDNHRCDGPCRKRNTDKYGALICSEVISEKFLPKKRGRKKRFFRDRRDRDDNSLVS